MKKIMFVLIFLLTFFIMSPNINALTSYTITEKCTAFQEPNEKGAWIVPGVYKYLDPGDIIQLIDDNKIKSTNSKCSSDYYHIKYSGYNGYVCGDYINFNNSGKYYDELRKLGFPESYLMGLNYLKEMYPNWNFVAVKTDLDWNESVNIQSSVGKNYVHANDPNGEDKFLLSLDGLSYNEATKEFIQQEVGGWYAVNNSTIAYYMDPRNYFNERDIFVFESNYYNDKYSDDFLTKSIEDIFTNNKLNEYTSIYLKTKEIGINPVFLATRSRQEVAIGSGVSGSASGYNGYYNFYNIGAYSSCSNPIYCGNSFAVGKGWTTPETAILGGGHWIYTNYIEKNQQTLYFQKFNVNNKSNTHAHQYMTNILAPKNEATLMYNAYKAANNKNSNATFYIPIYNSMPEAITILPTTMDQEELKKIEETTHDDKNTLSIDSIINGAGFSYNENTITKINLGMTYDELYNSIKSLSNSATITYTSNGVNKDKRIGTGDKITISNNGKTKTLGIVIYGDINGDGKISVLDLERLQQYLLDIKSLSDEYIMAADVDKQNGVKVMDLETLQYHLLEIKQINQ